MFVTPMITVLVMGGGGECYISPKTRFLNTRVHVIFKGCDSYFEVNVSIFKSSHK